MTTPDGEDNDMSRPDPATDPFAIDQALTNALIDGNTDPSSTSSAFGRVASVIEAASRPTEQAELRGEADAIAMFTREHHARSAPSSLAARRLAPSRSKRRAVVALVAGTLVLSGGVAAAATTGSLPAGLQHAAHNLMTRVGVSIPADKPTIEPSSADGQHQGRAESDPASTSACARTDPKTCANQGRGQRQDQTHGSDADHSGASPAPSAKTDHSPPTSVDRQATPATPVVPNNGHGSTSTSNVPHGKEAATTTTVGD